MSKIHQLSPQLIAKIAAGEVIERPAFAVKELIENAIDAKADDIQISIEQAGSKKIQVIDNGEGMSREDLEICWQPHTTSKISEEDTLIGIKSFGFRGEALASLAAISTLTIKSRIAQEATGNEITIQNGKYISFHPVGMPQGTVVIAENIFATIPARKKFLKSPQTEIRHIVDVVIHFAAAYPNIHFSLVHNKRIIIDTPKTEDTLERLTALVGQNTFQFFLPLKKADSYITLSGFIAKPQLTSSTSSKQFLFINKRKVTDKLLSLAVKEAFGTMLESTAYPVFILFLDIPYDLVDVNVHPRKEQVSFVNAQSIFQLVKDAVSEILQVNNITFQNLSWKRNGVGTTHSYAGKLLKELVLDKENLQIEQNQQLTQLHKLYIITQTKQGIIFIDQHAAHERILFEKLKNEFLKQKKKPVSIPLEKPFILQLSHSEKLLLTEHEKIFHTLGFVFTNTVQHAQVTMKDYGNKKIYVTHIPQLFQDRHPQEFILQLLVHLEQEQTFPDVDKTSEEMLAFLACRKAVKAGDTLQHEEMEKIITELASTPNNATCPHGRPTQIAISLQEIHSMFKRV